MYPINWEKIVPARLSSLVGKRLTRAYGSYFDCKFVIEFDYQGSMQFFSDSLPYKAVIEFEIVFNRQLLYDPLHLDATDVFLHNVGPICSAYVRKERHPERDAREIVLEFEASKKHFSLSELILTALSLRKKGLFKGKDSSIAQLIASYIQPATDVMRIRCFRKDYGWRSKQGRGEEEEEERKKGGNRSGWEKRLELADRDSERKMTEIGNIMKAFNQKDKVPELHQLYPIAGEQARSAGVYEEGQAKQRQRRIRFDKSNIPYIKVYMDVCCSLGVITCQTKTKHKHRTACETTTEKKKKLSKEK